ncbi:hypothetical protein VSU19_00040, partial [Verrucomicrobiales bacterium BCK34]|nr:hypothetical protein [Verrucomicrobiales bacterium BCK34]
LAHGNVEFSAGIQNSSSGDVTVIAGWNGSQYTAGAPGTAETGNVTFSNFTNNPASFGNASGAATGAVVVGDGTQTGTVVVGSLGGSTNVAGHSVSMTGGSSNNQFVQFGYRGAGTGAINVHAKGGGVTMQGGTGQTAFAQIGHGGAYAAGAKSGTVTVVSEGAVKLTGGLATTRESYAQIGHGGRSSGGDIGTSALSNVSVSAGASSVTLTGGNGENNYAKIGHGGDSAKVSIVGDIAVSGTGVELLAGTGSASRFASAQIGHGGRDARAGSGAVTVDAGSGDITMQGGAGGVDFNSAQIGHGGPHEVQGDNDGIVSVSGNNIDVVGGGKSSNYARIGHGGWISGANTGTRSGDIYVEASGELSIDGDTAVAQISHHTEDANSILNANVTIKAASADETFGDVAGTVFEVGNDFGNALEGALAGGDVTLFSTAADGVFMNTSGNMVFNSANDFNLLSEHDVNIEGSIQNGGTGNVNVVAGWNSTAAPLANPLTGIIADVDMQTDIFDVAGSFGNNSGSVLVSDPDGRSGVGSLDGDTNVAGYNVSLTGSSSGFAQIGYSGTGDGDGDITVRATEKVSLTGGTGYDVAYAIIGHGGNKVAGDKGGNITVEAGNGVSLTANQDGATGRFAAAQIGHGGRGVDPGTSSPNNYSGNITVNGGNGAVDVIAGQAVPNTNVFRHAQIGHGWSHDAYGDFSGNISVTGSEVNLDAGASATNYARVGHGGWTSGTNSGTRTGFIYVGTPGEVSIDPDSGVAVIGHHNEDATGTISNANVTIEAGSMDNVVGDAASNVFDVSSVIGNNLEDNLAGGDVSLHATGAGGLLMNSTGSIDYFSANEFNLLSDNNVTVGGNIQNSGAGNINVVAGWNRTAPGAELADPLTGIIADVDFANDVHGVAGAYGNNGGTVVVDADTVAAAVGSRSGQTNVAADGVTLNGSNTTLNIGAQIGFLTNSGADSIGAINVYANAGGISLNGGSFEGGYARIGHGGEDTDGNANAAITIESAGNIGLFSGGGTDAAAQIGHGGRNSDGRLQGNINVTSSGGEISVDSSNGGAQSFSQVGHGGYASIGDKGAVGEAITLSAANDVKVLSGGDQHAYAQVGNGGYNADADTGDDAGSIANISVTAGTDGGGSILMQGSGVADGHDNAYMQIGNGGYLSSGDHGGDIIVTAADDITMQVGKDVANAVMIGHGGHGASGLGGGVGHSGAITLRATNGSLRMIGSPTTAGYHNGYNSFVSVGHGGRQADGNHTGDIMVNVGDEVSMSGGLNDVNYRQIGHGGYQGVGDFSGSIAVTAENDVTLAAGTNDYTSARIGHGGRIASGDHSAAFITVTSNEGSIQVLGGNQNGDGGSTGDGKMAFAQIGLGGRDANGNMTAPITVTAKGDITVRGGGRQFNYAQIGNGGYDSDGDKTGTIRVESTEGKVAVLGADRQINAFAQIGHGGQLIDGALDGNITVSGKTGVDVIAGENTTQIAGGESFAQIGHGGIDVVGNKFGFVDVSTDGNISVLSGEASKAFSQIGHGGIGSGGGIFNGTVDAAAGGSFTITGGSDAGIESFAQVGHGGIDSAGNKTGIMTVSSGSNLSILSGEAEKAFALLGHGGVNSEGYIDGSITATIGGDLAITGGSGAAAGEEGEFNFAMIGHSLAGAVGGSGGYAGVNGSVVGEGEYFTATDNWIVLPEGTVLLQQPQPAGETDATYQFSNVRGGAYAQVPYGSSSGATTGSYVEYEFTVDQTGSYKLTPRWSGYNGNSDSMFYDIVELKDGTAVAPAVNDVADWYEFTSQSSTVFNWDTSGGGFEQNAAGDANQPAVWDLVAGTTYTLRATPRETGMALDAWTLQLDTLPNPTGVGPGATFANRSDISGASDINVTVGGDISLTSGAESDSYAAIGHGGSSFAGVAANVQYGTAVDGANISVSSSGGNIILDGNAIAGSAADVARRYAVIGHHGVDAGFDAYGNVEVHAGSGTVSLKGGNATDSFAQIGHAAGGVTMDDSSTLQGDICVVGLNGVSMTSTLTGERAYTQVGHGGYNVKGDFDGDVTVVASSGAVTLTGGSGGTDGQYSQIGHGGVNANGALSGDLNVIAGSGNTALTGGGAANSYAMIGHGNGNGTSAGTREGGVHLFSSGTLTATAGAGAGSDAFVYHQSGGGLAAGDYLGGDGFQMVANGGVTLTDATLNDLGTMVGGNVASGPISLAITNDIDITIGAGNDFFLDTAEDFYLLTGGDITMLSSYQNAGTGNVTLVAGWSGNNFSSFGSVAYSGTAPNFNYCEPTIIAGGAPELSFNCADFGINNSVLVLGDAAQTSRVSVGSRQGATSLAGYGLTMNASNSTAGAATQVGFYGNGSGDASGVINVGLKLGGLTMNSATSSAASGAFTQIGHGGLDATAVDTTAAADITISFCEPGAVALNAGSADSYSQIGHGGLRLLGSRGGDISIAGHDATSGAGAVSLNGGTGSQAYAQIGHGGIVGTGATSGGATSGDIRIRSMGKVDLTGGTQQDAYAQIGMGGHDNNTTTGHGLVGDTTVVIAANGVSLTGGDTVGSSYGAYAVIGNGGYDADGPLRGSIYINYDPLTGLADGGGDITLLASTKTTTEDNYGTVAQIGHGGRNQAGDKTGDIIIGNADMLSVAGAGRLSFARIGHGGNGATSGNVNGDVKVLNSTSVALSGGFNSDSYAQIGHGGSGHGGSKIGDIFVNSSGAISLMGGTGSVGFAQIGHGGISSGGTMTGTVGVIAGGALLLDSGTSSDTYAKIGHGGRDSDGTLSGAISINYDPTAGGGAGAAAGGGNITLSGRVGSGGSFSQIGHGGRLINGALSGDITVGTVDALSITGGGGSTNFSKIGHGGNDSNATDDNGSATGSVRVLESDSIILQGGTAQYTSAQIGHGGYQLLGDYGAVGDVIEVFSTGNVSILGGGTDAFAQIGHGGILSGGIQAGNIKLDAGGNIDIGGGSGGQSYGMVGHGGYNSAVATSGLIDVDAGGYLKLKGAANYAYAQIGHGGAKNATGVERLENSSVSNAHINVDAGGAIDVIAGAGTSNAYGQIGHGGFAHLNMSVATSDILVNTIAGSGGGVVTVKGAGTNAPAMIGHGGSRQNGDRGTGSNAASGDIKILNSTGIVVTGLSAADAFGKIGHGGEGGNGDLAGLIEVHTSGSVLLTSGSQNDTFAQIGHGRRQGDGDLDGNICVVAATGVILNSDAANGAQGYTMIGHGGVDSDGTTIDGNITVTSINNGVSLTGGVGTGNAQFAQIGHGGRDTAAAMSGNIYVVADNSGDITLTGGGSVSNYAMIGHGDSEGNTSSGTRKGGVHIFADGSLSATNGSGVENVNVYHQTSGGLTYPGSYLGGDGFQLIANAGAPSFANSAVDDISAMINGNAGGAAPVSVTMTNDVDIVLNEVDYNIDTGNDFYLLTGGNITILSSYQNEGLGDVVLVAGWDGTGATVSGSVDYPTVGSELDFCHPSIGENMDFTFNNCASFGVGDKTVTIGASNQTDAVRIGSRQGTTYIGAHELIVQASTTTSGAESQIGFYGDGSGDMTGATKIYLHEGGLTLNGGTTGAYAQIGHGGLGSNSGNDIDAIIDISFCDPGAISLNGGTGTDAYAQIGHGGTAVAGGQNRTGDISAIGFSTLLMDSGNGTGAYTQIGHGGKNAFGNTDGAVASSDITLTGSGDIDLFGGGGSAYSLVGHGGTDLNGSSVQNGSITLTTSGGTIDLIGGSSGFAQVGHGSQTAGGTKGLLTDNILVQANGSVNVQGGTGNNAYAQIGNGGLNTSGTLRGNLLSVISDTGDIFLTGGPNTGDDGYAHIGHGTVQTNANASGNILVSAVNGAVTMQAGGGRADTSGSDTPNFVQIGNGGHQNSGTQTGTITVLANSIGLTAGTREESYAQIGHGGFEDDTTADGALSGDIFINYDSVGGANVAGGGDITLNAAGGADRYAQIGHGGSGHISDIQGHIKVGTTSNLVLNGSGSEGYAQVGHGGSYSYGGTISNANIELDVVNAIDLNSGGSTWAYTQIGHGGANTNAKNIVDAAITINTAAGSGTGSITLDANGSNAYSQIGHGGARSDNDPDFGNKSGNITIGSAASITMTSGGQADSSTQIGHGGDGGAGNGSAGVYGGSISVTSAGALLMNGGSGTDSYSQIGHGGDMNRADMTGDVTVTLGGAATLTGGGTSDDSYTQIGHGGVDFVGNASGNVRLISGGLVQLNGGSATDNYALVGNGGQGVAGSIGMAGEVTVVIGNGIDLNSGSGTRAFTQIGAGGYNVNGTILNDTFVNYNPLTNMISGGGGITMNAGTGSNTYTQIGAGGQASNGTKTGNVRIEGNGVAIASGSGGEAFAHIGSGGGLQSIGGNDFGGGTVTGDTLVNAGAGAVTVDARGSAQAFAQIGAGGLLQDGNIDGTTTVNTTGDITLTGGVNSNNYAMIGTGGSGLDGNITNAATTVTSANLTLNSGSGTAAYTRIGAGGGSTGGSNPNIGDVTGATTVTSTGAIMLNAGTNVTTFAQIGAGGRAFTGQKSGAVNVWADSIQMLSGSGQDAYTQIGNGGAGSTGAGAGEVNVTATGGSIDVRGGTAAQGAYAQIGHGGTGSGTSNMSGDLSILVDGDFNLSGGATGAANYAMVGHGDATPTTGGTRSGAMKIAVSGDTTIADNNSASRLGHGTTATGSVSNSEFVFATVTLDVDDYAFGVSGTADVMGEGGDVSFAVLGGDLLIGGAGAFNNTSFHSNFVAAGNINARASVQNAGMGQVNLAAGWASFDGLDPITSEFDGSNGLLLDLDLTASPEIATLEFDFSNVAADTALWGAAGSVVTVGGGAQSASVGSAGGTSNVFGAGVVLQGSDTAANGQAQVGYFGSGVDMAGQINVLGVDGGLSVLGGDAAGAFAQVGHGGFGSVDANAVNSNITVLFSDTSAVMMKAGDGNTAYAQVGHGGYSQMGSKSGAIAITTGSVLAEGGGGSSASARVGNGGSRGSGDITGGVSVVARTGNVELNGGSGAFSEAVIGAGGVQYDAGSITSATTVRSPLDIILSGGTGVQANTQIGAGGLEATSGIVVGDVLVDAENDITLTGGTDIRAFSQIGNGGATASGDFSGKIDVEAANSIYLTATNGEFGAYAKIGHGDDLFSPTSTIGALSGSGTRQGDINVSAGVNLVSLDSMVGHVNDATGATATGGSTQIAVSTSAPKDPAAGSILADSDSEFSGAEDVRFYLPERSNNDVEAGALINGEAFAGAEVDPSVSQRDDEFTVEITGVQPSTPGEHTNSLDSGPAPVNAARFAFNYNSIELTDPVVVPPGGG